MNIRVVSVCRVCGYPSNVAEARDGDVTHATCERCGKYRISGSCAAILGNPHDDGLLNSDRKKASVGHWLREQQKVISNPLLTSDIITRLAADPLLPPLADQRENLLRMVGSRAGAPGEMIGIGSVVDQYVIGAAKPAAVISLAKHLVDEGLCEVREGAFHRNTVDFAISLTFNGWLEFEQMVRGRTGGRKAFMAMPFNKPDLDDEWLPQLKSAVKETGFDLLRNIDDPKPGSIDDRMRVQIKQSRFLIVELTHANLGAYWEAGYAEGLGKPVIYTCRAGDKAHFDVDHSLRIEWDFKNLPLALDRLKATIRNSFPDAYPAAD
jgi:hypothetical protein